MALTDTHCHLDLPRFDADRLDVLRRADLARIAPILVPSLDLASCSRVLALCKQHPVLRAAVGVHPTEVRPSEHLDPENLKRLALDPCVCAIGEIGLDYYWVTDAAGRLAQQQALKVQLQLAADLELPVVLHMREQADADHGACADDLLTTLSDWVGRLRADRSPLADRPGVLHSFAGDIAAAEAAIALGFYIGVTGPITYPRADQRRDLVRQLPLERLLIETDSPFLAPVPHRGHRNEPAFVVHIADRIAEVKSRTRAEIADATSWNAAHLFAWGEPD